MSGFAKALNIPAGKKNADPKANEADEHAEWRGKDEVSKGVSRVERYSSNGASSAVGATIFGPEIESTCAYPFPAVLRLELPCSQTCNRKVLRKARHTV